MLIQRVVAKGKVYVQIIMEEKHAIKLATLIDQSAQRNADDNPFGSQLDLLGIRDAIHNSRWGYPTHVHLP